jgi:hypothetical protein
MTNNYIKPELEMISLYSEGTILTGSGEDLTVGETFDAWN